MGRGFMLEFQTQMGNEREIRSTPWRKSVLSGFERNLWYPDGKEATETKNPSTVSLRTTEYYGSNARRSHYRFYETLNEANNPLGLQTWLRSQPLSVTFKEAEGATDLFFPEDFSVFASVTQKQDGVLWGLKYQESLLLAKYDAFGKLEAFFARAEDIDEPVEQYSETDPRISLPILLNYLRTEEPTSKILNPPRDLLLEWQMDDIEHRPDLIDKAQELSQSLSDRVLKYVDEGNREDAELFLRQIGFQNQILTSILFDLNEGDSLRKVLRKARGDGYIKQVIDSFIFMIKEANRRTSTRLISFINVTDEGTEFGELEFEERKGNKNRELHNRGIMRWGDRAVSQDREIEVVKEDGVIKVGWIKRGEVEYEISIPLEIDAAEARRIANDPDEDFRALKDLIKVGFRKFKK